MPQLHAPVPGTATPLTSPEKTGDGAEHWGSLRPPVLTGDIGGINRRWGLLLGKSPWHIRTCETTSGTGVLQRGAPSPVPGMGGIPKDLALSPQY